MWVSLGKRIPDLFSGISFSYMYISCGLQTHNIISENYVFIFMLKMNSEAVSMLRDCMHVGI